MPVSPSQLTFAGSSVSYAALLRVLSGPSPSATRFTKSIRAVSTIHSSLVTVLALIALQRGQWHSAGLPRELTVHSKHSISGNGGYPDDSQNPLITARSEFANSVTALEAGYLAQDIIALLFEAYLRGGSKSLDKTLLTHHVGIGAALLALHYYIAKGREAGIYVIIMFLLMNSSTPILNLRWYLRTFHPQQRRVLLGADLAFVVSFFMARVWLVWKILAEYGSFHQWTALEAYAYGLRLPCKLGTGALWTANLGWWIMLVGNVASRTSRFALGGE
ncbi:MAG: hypothetical protein LQ338_002173 [Usnochroma carphineum]|nr:MAG: hypothetical protein LQ338_002173 [Usnochroma carphineum]